MLTRSQGQSCPGPKSNLAQAQQEHASCIAARGFQALDSLPLVPLLASTTRFVRNSTTVADVVRDRRALIEAQEALQAKKASSRGADSGVSEVPRATSKYTREAAAAEAAANKPKAIRDRFVA